MKLIFGALCFAVTLVTPANSQHKIDGEEAAKRLEAVLRRGGIKGELSLESLSKTPNVPYYAKTKLWNVALSSGNSTWGGNVDEYGRVRFISATIAGAPAVGKPTKSEMEKRAWSMLDRLGKHPPVYFDWASASGDTIIAGFKVLVNGKKLFNSNPLYGYILRFTADDRLAYLIDEGDTPKANATQPNVLQEAATAKLSANAEVQRAQKESRSFVEATHSTWKVEAELGYFKVGGEPSARLVWRGKLLMTTSGHTSERLIIQDLIDARTGETFRPDYNSTER